MWKNKTRDTERGSVIEPIVTGDLVIDGKQLGELLALAKHLAEDRRNEFVDELRPLIDIGLIVENQMQKKNGYYAFVHWPDGHIEPRHTEELIKVEMLESFIEESLIWHL